MHFPMRIDWFLYTLSLASFSLLIYINQGFVTDDSYISFRYAENVLLGHGLVYNPGEYVEGYTNFLWVMLLVAGKALGVDYLLFARMLSVASALVTIYVIDRYLYSYTRCRYKTALATFFLSASIPFVSWIMVGMETVFCAVLLLGIVLPIIRYIDEKDWPSIWLILSGVCGGLAVLTRPDSAIIVATSGIALLSYQWFGVKRLVWKDLFYFGLPAALIVGLHLLWRVQYYGEWLPNTYWAKVAGIDIGYLAEKGLDYIEAFVFAPPYLLIWVLCTGVFVTWTKEQAKSNSYILAAIVLYITYIIRIGGDWMPAFRMMVPILPILVLLAARSFFVQEHRRFMVIAIVVIHIGQIANPYLAYRPTLANALPHWNEVTRYINAHWPKHSLIAINMSGYIPYKTMEYRYLDMLGLHDKHIARVPISDNSEFRNGRVGHMRGDGAYVLAQSPDYIILGAGFQDDRIEHAKMVSEKQMKQLPEFYTHYEEKQVDLEIPATHNRSSRHARFVYYQKRKDIKNSVN